MRFADVIGNERLKSRLISMVDSGRTGHSLMFVEEDGYGALPLALALIQYLSCPEKQQGRDSCGVCPTCRKLGSLMHPDLHFAFPVNVSSRMSSSKKPLSAYFMDEWRELCGSEPYFTEAELYAKCGMEDKAGVISVAEAKAILDSLSLKSYEGKNKYMLVWLPEKMNAEAANRLLKIVEEPSPETYFIFVTHAPEKVIRTIRSRSQLIRLQPIPTADIAAELQSKAGMDAQTAQAYATSSAGSLGKALELARDDSSSDLYFGILCRILDLVAKADLPDLLRSYDELLDKKFGRERQKDFCVWSEAFLRKIMLCSSGLEALAGLAPGEAAAVRNFSLAFPPAYIEAAFRAFDDARTSIEANANAKMVFCNLVGTLYRLKHRV